MFYTNFSCKISTFFLVTYYYINTIFVFTFIMFSNKHNDYFVSNFMINVMTTKLFITTSSMQNAFKSIISIS